MTGDRVILVGRTVRLVIIVKLWQITVVLALPHLAEWVVAAAIAEAVAAVAVLIARRRRLVGLWLADAVAARCGRRGAVGRAVG
jgi:hypothetical protein